MKKLTRVLVGCAWLVLTTLPGRTQTTGEYRKEMERWGKQRITDLKAENGWLNLAGLFWLENGRNNFGSGAANPIVFPKGAMPKNAGYFYRNGDSVSIHLNKGIFITINGKPVQTALLFQNDTAAPIVAAYRNLRFTIIKRGNRMGIRLRNLAHPGLVQFKGIKRYLLDSTWNIPATLQTGSPDATIGITNVLGQTTQLKLAGRLQFTRNNQTYTLDALEEGNELFIIFADATNKKNTYPSGRFIYVQKPGPNGQTFIDFNKAINPPCAFTPYATCPLPPPQNRLPIAVTAGEQRYDH